MSERWADELMPDEPQWVRDLVNAEIESLRSRLAEAEALLQEAIPDASKVCPDTWRAKRDAHLSREQP